MENCADKISKQLDAVLEAKPTMYAKTKERYKHLAYSLLQSVTKISNILEEESLIGDESFNTCNEFDELSNKSSYISDAQLSDAVDNVKTHISSYNQFTGETSENRQNKNKLSNKQIISQFATVLEDASNHLFICKEATECAQVINRWFKARFVPAIRNYKFKYNIKQIPVWISYIIILFGKYQSMNQTDKFIEIFDRWCKDVETNDENKWALPFEVFELTKCVKPEYFTLNAVIIGDILMTEKYHLLTEAYFSNSHVVFECSHLVSIVKSKNPSLIPKIRVRLSKQDQLINECSLTYTRR